MQDFRSPTAPLHEGRSCSPSTSLHEGGSCRPNASLHEGQESRSGFAFRLTPAEWRQVLADGSFLRDPDNCIRPRRLMGVPVEIIPDHGHIGAT